MDISRRALLKMFGVAPAAIKITQVAPEPLVLTRVANDAIIASGSLGPYVDSFFVVTPEDEE